MKGVSELEARLDGLREGELDWARFELDWARLGDTELVRDLRCLSLASDLHFIDQEQRVKL